MFDICSALIPALCKICLWAGTCATLRKAANKIKPHSTGNESRLARKSLLENKGMDAEGEDRKTYAEEELVAEMGASFLNAHAGIMEAEIENSAAYLQGWINALKSKDAKGWIIRAASQAQKAANYILNLEVDNP